MAQFDYWAFWGRPQPTPLPTSFQQIWGSSSSALGAPPLAFLFSLPALALAAEGDAASYLYLARLTSVLLSVLVVVVGYLVAKQLFPGDSALIRVVPSFLFFLPMYSFMSASYTNQAMANLAGALCT